MVTLRPLLLKETRARRWDGGALVLLLTFVALLPLFTPRLYATDSVQYYVYLRSLFFDGDLDFSNDYARFNQLNPDAGIQRGLLDPDKHEPLTGRPLNVAPIGSALLWTPVFLLAHGGVLLAQQLGSPVTADGFSPPYIWAVCLASALYGLLGILLCYRIARRYASARAATAATLGCWLASPLVFYMYVSPPWSHTAGLFATALFIWYWLDSGPQRTLRQWLLLGVIGGLMVLTREQLGLFLLLPAVEALAQYIADLRLGRWAAIGRRLGGHMLFLLALALTWLPQLFAYHAVNGRWGPSRIVAQKFDVRSPHALATLIDVGPSPVTGLPLAHGALLWTPIWALGLLGLLLLLRRQGWLALLLLLTFAAQVWINGSFLTWHLSGAFGFRRLIEATPLFVLGVAALIDGVRLPRSVWALIGAALIIWNVGLIGQWTVTNTALRRGLIWDGMLRQQLNVPAQVGQKLEQILFDRCALVKNCASETPAR
jgi:hypothetical protein